MSNQKLITLRYYKLPHNHPKERVPLMRFGEWCEVYRGEVLLAHKDHDKYLTRLGFVPANNYTYFKTAKEALAAKKNITRQRFTE